MRIYLKTTPNKVDVPFNYQPKLVGTLHKWLGKNDIHGHLALHSFSWLRGGKAIDRGLDFENGATIFISFYDCSRIKQIVKTIFEDPGICCGMKVTDITIEEDPDLADRNFFRVGSPVFIKREIDGNEKHFTYEDKEAGQLLVETIHNKMKNAGILYDETLKIHFADYDKKKVKVINYNGIDNKVSLCPVVIEGRPDTKTFIWNVGIGNSTGIGFGSIY